MSKQSKPHHSPPLCHFDKGKGRANLTARGAADNLLEDHYVPFVFPRQNKEVSGYKAKYFQLSSSSSQQGGASGTPGCH